MEDDVFPAALLRKDDAVLVFAGDARPVTVIAVGRQEIVGRHQTDTRAFCGISRVGNRVSSVILEPRDPRILHAPLFVRSGRDNSRRIADFVDASSIRGKCARTSSTTLPVFVSTTAPGLNAPVARPKGIWAGVTSGLPGRRSSGAIMNGFATTSSRRGARNLPTARGSTRRR